MQLANRVFFSLFVTLLLLQGSSVTANKVEPSATQLTLRVSPDCAVRFLTASSPERLDPKKFPDAYKYKIVEKYGPNQEQLIQTAFSAVPPFVCKAVNRVAFVTMNNGDARAWVDAKRPDLLLVVAAPTTGKLVFATEEDLKGKGLFLGDTGSGELISARKTLKSRFEVWSLTIKTVMHEATHSAINLLESIKSDPEDNLCSDYEKFYLTRVIASETGGDTGFKAHKADYYPDFFESGAKTDGKSIRDKTGLQEGLYNEWCRMQKAFLEAKMAPDYDQDIKADNSTDPPEKGFFSKYGQRNPTEDIAEVASLIQFNLYETQKNLTVGNLQHTVLSEGERQRYKDIDFAHEYYNVCKEKLQTTSEIGVPPDLAAIFTKMSFLLDIGFITEEAYKACKRGGKLGLQNGGKETTGFHVLDFETGAFKHSYELTNIGHAPVGSESDDRSFILIGKGNIEDGGKQRNLDFWLRFNTTRTNESEKIYNLPRGIYKLDWDWQLFPGQAKVSPCPPLFSETDAPFTFYVNSEDAPSRSFCTVNGQILVTRSSKDFFEATLYVHKVLKRVGGSAVQLPSPFAVAGIPVPFLAGGVLVPEVPNFRVYIRWER